MGMGGLGSLLGYADALVAGGGPTAYRLVGGVTKIQPPAGPAARDIPVPPALDGDGHLGHVPGADDTAPHTFGLPYAAAAHAVLDALRRLAKRWIVIYPDHLADLYPGYLSKVTKEEIDAERLMTLDAEIVVTGKPAEGQSPGAPTSTFTKALTDGAATVDLTALAGVDALSKPLLRLQVTNNGAANLTVTNVVASGYLWKAAGDVTVVIAPGQTVVLEGDASTLDVDNGHKVLSLSGTAAQTSSWKLSFGALGAADLEATAGDPAPNPATPLGDWYLIGTYGGRAAYRHSSGDWFLWGADGDPGAEWWYVTAALGEQGADGWSLLTDTGLGPTSGSPAGYGTYTGLIIFAEPA